MLDGEAAALELADERPQELMPATGRRRLELVEHGEVGAVAPRPEPVRLHAHAPGSRARQSPRRPRNSAPRHGVAPLLRVQENPFDPIDVPRPGQPVLDGAPGAGTESTAAPFVAENLLQRALEHLVVAGRDEPAVLAVDEPVPGRDRLRARDDDGLPERHGLEEHGRRARVAVLEDGQCDDASLLEPAPHRVEWDVRPRPRDSKAALRARARDPPC